MADPRYFAVVAVLQEALGEQVRAITFNEEVSVAFRDEGAIEEERRLTMFIHYGGRSDVAFGASDTRPGEEPFLNTCILKVVTAALSKLPKKRCTCCGNDTDFEIPQDIEARLLAGLGCVEVSHG